MIALKPLLVHLLRVDVTEVVLRDGRPPAIRVGDALEKIDDRLFSHDDILQVLFATGGSRYLDSLDEKETHWRTRVEGLGGLSINASMRDGTIEAHITLRDRSAVTSPQIPAKGPAKVSDVPVTARTGTPMPTNKPVPKAPPRPVASSATPVELRPAPSASLSRHDTPPSSRSRRQAAKTQPTRPEPSDFDLDLELDLSGELLQPTPLGNTPQRTLTEEEIAAELRKGPSGAGDPHDDSRWAEGPETARYIPGDISRAAFARAVPALTPETKAPPPESVKAHGSDSLPLVPTMPPAAHRGRRTTRPFARDPQRAVFRALLETARDLGASDLHLVAGRTPLFRVAGQIISRGEPLESRSLEDMFLSRVPSRLNDTLANDGSCDFALEEEGMGRYRVNVSRQRTGLKASLRVIGREIPTLQSLGLPEAIESATHHHQGLIVLTGPTGHGKTTTLAAVVDILNRGTTRHIISVEDPIEYIHPRKRAMISQREVGTHTRSFQTALKASLREDPDVIVVGELRDTETVRMALSASETGHLVIGTMNTPSAAKTIDRLIDLFPPADQQQVRMTLAGGLRLVVSQRLLPDAEGHQMVAAAELLPGTVALWNLIRDSRTYQIPSLQQRGKSLGVIRLDDSLASLVRAGRTTAAAAIAVAEFPEDLEAQLVGRRAGQATAPIPPNPPPPPLAPKPEGPNADKGLFERAGSLFGKKS